MEPHSLDSGISIICATHDESLLQSLPSYGLELGLDSEEFQQNGCHQLLIQSQNHLCWIQSHVSTHTAFLLPVKLPWPPNIQSKRGWRREVREGKGEREKERRIGNPLIKSPNRPANLWTVLSDSPSNMYFIFCTVKLPSNLRN